MSEIIKGKEMLAKPVYKTLLIILVIAVCFAFAYIKDVSANAGNVNYGHLFGKIYGNPWTMKSAVLKKKVVNDSQILVLEFNELDIEESKLCDEDLLDSKKLLVQIPVSSEKGLNLSSNEDITIRMNGNNDMNVFSGYQRIELDLQDSNSIGKAFVDGILELDSGREQTSIAGKFVARVCN